jgi:glutamate racemase
LVASKGKGTSIDKKPLKENGNFLVNLDPGSNSELVASLQKGLKKLGYFNLLPKATPLFVPLVEDGIYEGEILEASFRYYFNGIDKVDAIILGCTHFPLIQKKICEFFPIKPVMIHSGEAIVEYLENNFDFTKTYKETNLKFFASENPTSLKEVAKKWLQLN